MLSCSCGDYEDGWYYYTPDDFITLKTSNMMTAACKYVFKNMMSDTQFVLFEKTLSVLYSCKSYEQVRAANNYSKLASKKAGFPWDINGHITAKVREFNE